MNLKTVKLVGMLLIIAVAFMACDNSHPGFKKSKSGIYYKIISQVDSLKDMKADSGMFYVLEMNYGTADSLIFKSEFVPDQVVKIPFRKQDYAGDIWEALSMFSKGDSVHFIIRADSFFLKTTQAPEIPEIFLKDNEAHFYIKVKNIQSQQEIDAERAAYINARREAEVLEIAKFVNDNNWSSLVPLASGLYFNKIQSGKGRPVKEGMYVTFDFEIRLLNGGLIYSSIEANFPGSFKYGERFDTQGLMEALGLMKVGDEAELLIPSALAFGEGGRPGMIDPHTPLHYFVRLTAVKTEAEHQVELAQKAKEEEARLQAMKMQEPAIIAKYIADNAIGVQPTASGLYFISTLEGTGAQPIAGDKVKVHYSGTLLNGTKFDSSYDRNQPFEFTIGQGQVIKGWDEGIALLKVGGKATLILPSELAYGERQAGEIILPFSPLKFEVELIEIVK